MFNLLHLFLIIQIICGVIAMASASVADEAAYLKPYTPAEMERILKAFGRSMNGTDKRAGALRLPRAGVESQSLLAKRVLRRLKEKGNRNPATPTTTTGSGSRFGYSKQMVDDAAPQERRSSYRSKSARNFNQSTINCLDKRYRGKTFCTEVLDYPDLTPLRTTLRADFGHFFKAGAFVDTNMDPDATALRFRLDFGEEFLCQSRERLIFPRKAESIDDGWYYIINDDDLQQGVLIEECIGSGRACKYMADLPDLYVSICKQSYIYRLMVALDNQGRHSRIVERNFKFPSTCKCAIKKLHW